MKNLFLLFMFFLSIQTKSSLAIGSEETWQSVQLTLPSLNNKVQGYMTDLGTLRIDRIESGLGPLQISGGKLTGNQASDNYRCQMLAPSLGVTKNTSKNVFLLKALANPIAKAELLKLQNKFENVPSIYAVEVKLNTSVKSLITPLSVKDFEARLLNLIKAQMNQVTDTGVISIEMTKADDVICDLVMGQSTLDINMGVMQERAKHKREQIISTEDFIKIYEDVRSHGVPQVNAQSTAMLNGASLVEAMRTKTSLDLYTLGSERFLKIANALFNKDSGLLLNLRNEELEKAARSTDLLTLQTEPALLRTTLLVPQVSK